MNRRPFFTVGAREISRIASHIFAAKSAMRSGTGWCFIRNSRSCWRSASRKQVGSSIFRVEKVKEQ
jgi:hypothetical protein